MRRRATFLRASTGLAIGMSLAIFEVADTPLAARLIAPQMQHHTTGAAFDPSGVIAGALRNGGEGWRAIIDAHHAPVNIAAVSTSRHTIRIEFAQRGQTVRTFIAAPDETLARAGFVMGASVGLDHAEIVLSRPGWLRQKQVSPALVEARGYPWSNIWIYGVVEGACPPTS